MTPRMLNPRSDQHPRGGFSLVELVVVIAIIAVLIALIFPALNNARSGVSTVEVGVEIKAFEQGIAEFKNQYGQEPPSGIALYEAATGDPSWSQHGASGSTTDAQRIRSQTLIRQMFPQFDFSFPRNLNGDADSTDVIGLTGDEALLFFLGGVNTIAPAEQATANGFSSNPSDPFASGGNRVGPFGEFDPDRMIDTDGDGAHAYKDIYQDTNVAYMYLSSYGGRGYRVQTDGDFDADGTPQLFIAIDNDGNGSQDEVGYAVYMQKDPDSARPSDEPTTREDGEVAWKENSFQIICAGPDGIFGCPGIWSAEDGISHNFTGMEEVLNLPEARDNITNFSGGTLE